MENHKKGSEAIQDMVIGMSDGLTVPFALAAGLSGAVAQSGIILTAGIAEIIAGSIAMGLGGYLAGTAQVNHYNAELKREYEEVELLPEKEKQEVKDVFKDYGLSERLQNEIAEEMSKNKDKWVQFMMRFELDLNQPDPKRPLKSGLTIACSYIVGGAIPMLPYMLVEDSTTGLKFSAMITLLALFVFGMFKSKVTGQPVLGGALKVTLIGALAASAAYGIAKLMGV